VLKHRVGLGAESEQVQNILLEGREGREVTQGGLGQVHQCEGDLLEGAQQAFGGGLGCGPRGAAGVQASQRALLGGQALPHRVLRRREHPQRDAQETDQAGDMLVARQIKRRERERTALEAAEGEASELRTQPVGQGNPVREVMIPIANQDSETGYRDD